MQATEQVATAIVKLPPKSAAMPIATPWDSRVNCMGDCGCSQAQRLPNTQVAREH